MQMSPEDVQTLANRAYLYRKIGEFERAVEDYTTALHLSPSQACPLRLVA